MYEGRSFMIFFRILLVIMLCIPVGYLALILFAKSMEEVIGKSGRVK